MQLFYAPDITPPLYTLSEEESKHCVRVLRLGRGDTLHITDGRGNLFCCQITDDNPKRCTVRVTTTQAQWEPLPYRLVMAVAPTKNADRFEWFLEKATEVGVSAIVPLETEHSERRVFKPERAGKVITAAMGVDSGKATYYTTLNCSGAYGVAKETYHCAGKKSHGVQNLAEALRNSCNIYFIQLGQRLGSSVFYDYFDAFGFTERTGVDLPNETGMMKYYTKNQLGEVQLASSAFGQAMAVTPLQVCTAISAAVNGGYLVTPHVVDKITDQNGNVVEEVGANVRRQVISESASETIRQIMEYEVGDGSTNGGGSNAYVAGYRIGGKSGTSEQLNMERRADGDYKKVASFAAVLPADDPEIIVYVMLDDPNNARTDYSSLLAAPVVGNIISEIAPYLGIAADGEDRSQTVVTVPNLVGTEWSSAQVQLNIKGLRHQLAESTTSQAAAAVTYQYPHAGAKVAYGTTVYLYTDTYEGSHTDVPDVTGKSADFARQMLSAAGLNCVVEGNANGTVQAQSADPGSSVQRGTIVTITCG